MRIIQVSIGMGTVSEDYITDEVGRSVTIATKRGTSDEAILKPQACLLT